MLLPVIELRMFSGRVGSTLLMQLLASTPEVALDRVYPYENRYLTYAVHLQQVYPLPFEPAAAEAPLLRREALRGIWEGMSAALVANEPAARFYAEKQHPGVDLTPAREAGISWRVLELVRDPRDVLVSIREFNRKRGYPAFGRELVATEGEFLEAFIARTRVRMHQFECAPDATESRAFVRYEDLVADLPATSARLGAWLGIDLDADAVLRQRGAHAGHMTSAGDTTSAGRWRTELSPLDQRLLTEGLAKELARMGYEA